MAMNLECMLYLQRKGILTRKKNRILDIGPQNVYYCTTDQIRQFVESQGGDVLSQHFIDESKRLEYFSTPRKEERTTLFSEITDLTNIEYLAFDVCPAFRTEIFDLNYDQLSTTHREYYDVLLNFGTTEHIFNQWNCFKVMHEALKIGGVLYCVLPASGYLDHGYYCYTPLFFKDLANANGYQVVDMFFSLAGENRLYELGVDIRSESQFSISSSAKLEAGGDKVPCFNIHVVMRKLRSTDFRCNLEIATSHSEASAEISARYDRGTGIVSQEYNKELADLVGIRKSSEKETGALVVERDQFYTERDELLRKISHLVENSKRLESEKDARISERDQYRTERDELARKFSLIQESWSWCLTKPLRILSGVIRRIT